MQRVRVTKDLTRGRDEADWCWGTAVKLDGDLALVVYDDVTLTINGETRNIGSPPPDWVPFMEQFAEFVEAVSDDDIADGRTLEDVLAYRAEQETAKIPHRPNRHNQFVDGCSLCEEIKSGRDPHGPRHFASARCQSHGVQADGSGGHRSHCTCDTCY